MDELDDAAFDAGSDGEPVVPGGRVVADNTVDMGHVHLNKVVVLCGILASDLFVLMNMT